MPPSIERRRDRDGDLIELVAVDDDRQPPHRCAAGWVGQDTEGRPRPCPECKPWLVERGEQSWHPTY